MVVVSLDPREGPEACGDQEAGLSARLRSSGRGTGPPLPTGTREFIEKLADGVGFRFYYDQRSGSPVHSTGLMVCTPQGKLSRYLLGVDYAPRDLNLALVEAAKTGSARSRRK